MCCFVRNTIFLVEFSLWKFQVNLWVSLWAEANTCWLFESIYSWKVSCRELKFPENTAKTVSLFKMSAKQAMKEICSALPNMVIYVYRRRSVMYRWQIWMASLPYMGMVTIFTIILRNRAEYHLILSRRGRRPSWLNQGIFRKIDQDNCFIIQQILINYHFHNEKNYGSMMKTLKASNT